MNRTLYQLWITQEEGMLLYYGLRHPDHLLEGIATNPKVARKVRELCRRLDAVLNNEVPWGPD